MDSDDLLVLECFESFVGVTGLIMRSVKLQTIISFPNAHSALCLEFAVISHRALVNTKVFIRSLVIIFLTGQLPKMNVSLFQFVARHLE